MLLTFTWNSKNTWIEGEGVTNNPFATSCACSYSNYSKKEINIHMDNESFSCKMLQLFHLVMDFEM